MTNSIAHEINQPLTAISMYAQAGIKLIERGKSESRNTSTDDPDLDKLESALGKLNTQALRAGAVIERIQRFASAQESHREIININELVIDLVKLAESDARLHNIELREREFLRNRRICCLHLSIRQKGRVWGFRSVDRLSPLTMASWISATMKTLAPPSFSASPEIQPN